MTRERLEQFIQIVNAIKILEKDIERINRQIKEPKGRRYRVRIEGSSSEFPYIKRGYTVEGVDYTPGVRLKIKLTMRKWKLLEEKCELEDWLEDIKDPLLYNIFQLKYRDGQTNEKIGAALGYSESRISQLANDYLKIKD